MKKIFLFAACITLILGSCKKDSSKNSTSTATSTFSATIGGVNETFTSNISATYATITGQPGETLGITSFRGSGTTEEGMQVAITSSTTVATGVYTINTTNNNEAAFPVIAYYKNISSSSPLTFGTDVSGVNVSTVTITALTSTNVQGTFSGVLIDESGSGNTETITDGKFNVNISSK